MSTIWEKIVFDDQSMLDAYNKRKHEERLQKGQVPLASNYFEKDIYPQLMPALKTIIQVASHKSALKHQRCIFNGIDCLAEVLYNRNPKHSERVTNWTPAYFLFFNPETVHRPIYPLSWILSRSEAALIIQKWLRGYNVRKTIEVQEMKEFWKAIDEEGWVLTTRTVPAARCKRAEEHNDRWY